MTTPTTSDGRIYVWSWLHGDLEPVVAGVVRRRGPGFDFLYGRSYLQRSNAVSLGPELPLVSGWQPPVAGLDLMGCLRDATPDAWGRRVIEARFNAVNETLPEATYMLESGSNRFGAIDFQASATAYVPRADSASLDELHGAARQLEQGKPLTPVLEEVLIHGTTIGGARPKVLFTDQAGGQWIAKLSSTSDTAFSVVNAEAAALWLARKAGISVPETRVTRSLGRDVLLVRRFDRPAGGGRHHCISALSLVGLGELSARYATYPMLLDLLRERSTRPNEVGGDLFARIVFNIAIGNSDDHARNHAAFWDGTHLTLTPAFDLSPGPRSGETATQAMAIGRDGTRDSRFATCVNAAPAYGLGRQQAHDIIDGIVATIADNWVEAADHARLSERDRNHLWHRQFLNPYASHGYDAQPRSATVRTIKAPASPSPATPGASKPPVPPPRTLGICGKPTSKGRPCSRRGRCPYHG